MVQSQENQPKKLTSVVWVLKLAIYPKGSFDFEYPKPNQNEDLVMKARFKFGSKNWVEN
jgi:hypothetical protein